MDSHCRFLPLVFVLSLLAFLAMWAPRAHALNGAEIRVVDIGTSPTAVDLARAYEDFEAGHIVRMVGGSPESLFRVLRIRLDQTSVQSTLKTKTGETAESPHHEASGRHPGRGDPAGG